MVVGISVGSYYDLKLSYSDSIKFIKNYPVDGIELLFATPKNLLDFEFEKEDLEFINSLKFKSIHMPFYEVEYKKDESTKLLIEKASLVASQINADYLVFHPNNVKDYLVLDRNFKNCIENLNSKERNKGFQTVNQIKQILEENELGLIVDTCHSLEMNINPKDFLELKDKICGLHLAVQWKQGERIRTHGFLQENLAQLEQIKPLLKIDVPKIIEVDIYPEKIPLVQKDINLIISNN
jgi:endonuclease IV